MTFRQLFVYQCDAICSEDLHGRALKDDVFWPCTGTACGLCNKDNFSILNAPNNPQKTILTLWKFLPLGKHLCKCWKVLKKAPCLNTFQCIPLHFAPSTMTSSVLLCYLSCAWRWEWRRALSFGRRLCAVDHESIRVWLCTSLQNKLYLFPLPVSWLLEGAPNSPTKTLQEGCSGCGSGRQLCGGKKTQE